MPPIITDKNTNYGPPLVTQKYRPLENVGYTPADTQFYSSLLTNRWNLLNAAGLLPQDLALATPNWAAVIAAEANHNPPLIVISSNRSTWIRDGVNAADNQLAVMNGQPATFTNPSDLRALSAQAGQGISPPIYCPTRLGANPNRNVYVVVHMAEYQTYRNNLANTGITVVGWVFRPVNGLNVQVTGFGASRFAAIEFCKELRTAAAAAAGGNAPWNFAWLFDDNVVALTNFPGFATVEGAMTPAHVCAGFRGGTRAMAFTENRDWARNELTAGRGVQAANLPASIPPGILQQAALWNIDYLTANHLNFGPVYITSGEDLSFGYYFDRQAIPYFYYDGITIRKEDTNYDNGTAAQRINQAKQQFTAWVVNAESAAAPPPGGAPPPPINVQPINQADGGVQTLANFVVNRVLPNANNDIRAQAGNPATQNIAKCQAVELITCEANSPNRHHVAPAALTTTFHINGAANQVVVRRNVP